MISEIELEYCGPETLSGKVAEGAAVVVVGAAVVDVVGAAVAVAVVEVAVVDALAAVVDEVDASAAVVLVELVLEVLVLEVVVSTVLDEVLVVVLVLVVEGVVAVVVVELETSSAVDGPQLTAMTAASVNAAIFRLLANSCRCGVSGSGNLDPTWEQFDDLLVELIYNTAQRKNVQHTLAVLQQINDLLAAANECWLATVHDKVGGCDVFAKFVLEVGEHFADLFEPNTGVEQVLDHLELEKVAIAVLAA